VLISTILSDLGYPFIDIHLDPEKVYKEVYYALNKIVKGQVSTPFKRAIYTGDHPIEKFEELL
jgi:hypothetical protein